MRSKFFLLLSSRCEVFCEKGLRPATLLKKGLWHRCFFVNFVKFLRTSFLIEHFWWLLLAISSRLYWVEHFCYSKLVIQRMFILRRNFVQFWVVQTFQNISTIPEKLYRVEIFCYCFFFGVNLFKHIICRLIAILSKHALPCFCVSPWQLLNFIRSGMLLWGGPSRNSALHRVVHRIGILLGLVN